MYVKIDIKNLTQIVKMIWASKEVVEINYNIQARVLELLEDSTMKTKSLETLIEAIKAGREAGKVYLEATEKLAEGILEGLQGIK